MFKNFIKNLDRKKLKMFAVFLVFSFLSWSISKLSQSYESWVDIDLMATKFPDSLLLKENYVENARLKLKASGFRLMGMQMGSKRQKVDLSSVSNKDFRFFITDQELQNQWERRFSNAEILSIQPDTLFFDLYQVQSKKIKIEPSLGLELMQNHVLVGELTVEPDSILIKGPLSEIGEIQTIKTTDFTLRDISTNFQETLKLIKPESLVDSEISANEVVVSGTVVRFSERMFTLPIFVENTPENYEVRIFPKTISLLCKAGENDLRKFSEENFRVIAVYDSTKVNQKTIRLNLSQKPENAISVRLLEDEVKFVLEPK